VAPEDAARKPGAGLLVAGGAGAALVLGRTSADALARGHGISRATARRYRDEVTKVHAARAPDLRQALERARVEGRPHLINKS